MEKPGNGGAEGSRGPVSRAPIPGLPAIQAEVNRCALLSADDLKLLIVKAIDNPSLDLRPFSCLTPRQIAELVGLPEWQILVRAMVGSAVVNQEDRWTKSQWRALSYFGRSVGSPKADKARTKNRMDAADVIEVEPDED